MPLSVNRIGLAVKKTIVQPLKEFCSKTASSVKIPSSKEDFVVNLDKMSKDKDLSTIVGRYITHYTEPRFTQYKVFPVGTKVQTPHGIKTIKKGEVVLIERGLKGEQYLTIEKAEDVMNQRDMAIYSKDGKLEQMIKNSAQDQLTKVEKSLKEKGVEFVGVKDSDKYFLDENLLVKINGKLYELNPNGVGYPKNDNGLSVKKMLLNTIEKYGHLKPEEVKFEELYDSNVNPYFLEAFLKAQK